MPNRLTGRQLLAAALCITGLAGIATVWQTRFAAGLLAGGFWNLASLWCLTQLLDAWLGPRASRRRAVGWLIVKFPLLYLAVFLLLSAPTLSVVGFGVGFTVVLALAISSMAWHSRRLAHGR